jgi:hypothetical protein
VDTRPPWAVGGRVRGRRGQHREPARLAAEHRPPQSRPVLGGQHVGRVAGHARPGALGQLAGQLARGPPGVAGEDPQPGDLAVQQVGVAVEVDQVHRPGDLPQPAVGGQRAVAAAGGQAQRRVGLAGAADVEDAGFDRELGPPGQHVAYPHLAGPAEHHADGAGVGVVEHVDHGAGEGRVGQRGHRDQQRPGADVVQAPDRQGGDGATPTSTCSLAGCGTTLGVG